MENNTDMKIVNGVPMMSSREIAETTGKSVSAVHADIRAMVPALYAADNGEDIRSYAWGTTKDEMMSFLNHHNIQGIIAIFDDRGYVHEFLLDRRHTEILVSGYDIKRRAAIIDRWFSLESGKAQPRIAAPVPQAISASDHILSVARVVAEATASATMKAVMEITGSQVFATQALPPASPERVAPVSAAAAEPVDTQPAPEFSLVTDLVWAFGLSDPACRRLASYANLPTKRTKGERGYLLIHRISFAEAAFTLIDESIPPVGKRKRWKHPDFGDFSLKVTEANKDLVEAKQ